MRFSLPSRLGGSKESRSNFSAVERALNDHLFPLTLWDNGQKCVISFDSATKRLFATHDGVEKTLATW